MKEEEMLEGDEEYEDSDSYSCLDPPMPGKGKGKGKRERKRRFSDDQIRSLESMFESQTKVEPRKKMQLAKELGLQPRQVSIWFQNKRARWKSKQLETEFGALKADYDALLSNFESLKKEKHSLLKQLQKLADLLEKGPPDLGNNNSDSGTSGASNEERELNRALTEGLGFLRPNKVQTDEEQTRISCYLEKQEEPLDHHHNHHPLPYMIDPTTDGCCFDDAGCFSDQSCNTSQWWEVWPLNE